MSLRAKVLLPLAFFSILLVGYLYGHYMPNSLANIEANYRQAAERHLDSVIEGLIPLLLGHQLDTIYENLDALMKKNNNWIGLQLTDDDGRLLYPLNPSLPVPGDHTDDDVHVLSRQITYLGMNLGSLTVKVDFDPLLADTRQRHRELITIMVSVIVAFILCAAFVLDRLVVRPVNALSRASRNLAQGNFDGPLRKAGNDEVGQLVDRFGEMRDAMQGYQTELLERSRVLARSEQSLAEAQRIAHLGSWELDLRKNELVWSDEVYRIFGLPPQEFGATFEAFLDSVHPDDREYVNGSYTRSLREKVPYDIVHRIIRKSDGAIRYVHEKCEHVRDEHEAVKRSRGTVHDVTELKRAEEEVRQLASIVESSDDAIFSKTLDGVILTWNRAAERMYGYSADEVKGRSVSLLTPPDHPDDVPGILEKIRNGEHVYQYETVRMKKNGERIDVSLTVSPVHDASGAIIGASAIGRDITEKKRTDEELKFKNVLLATQQETSLDGILAVDEHGRIISYNRRYAEIWGVPSEIIESGIDELALRMVTDKLKDPVSFLARVKHLYAHTDEKSRDELSLKDGRILDRYSSPMVGPDERYFGRVWYFRDVTEQKKLEEQLRQAQKMEAIGQLAGGVAHDFNNILTAIIGYGTMLRMKLAVDDPLRVNVDHVLEAAERATQLTRSLLAFSRKQVMHLSPVKPNEIVAHLEKFLRRIIGEDIELKTILRDDAVVMADSGQLEQVLMNLATNARDAMSRGGQLTIETGQVSLEKDSVRMHGVDVPGTYVVISVTDTGSGMDDQTKQKIFEPFFTTKEVGRGTGLGLAIVYGIVRQHQGYINVYSQVGTGTTFRIYLPVHGAPVEKREAAGALPPVIGGTEAILLVEDDRVLRTMFTDILTEFGYRIIVAENGKEAVDTFQAQKKGAIPLCILDMIMPKMNGIEAYEQIRKQDPGVKAIFMSGYTADKIAQEGIPEGCAFIQKPVQQQLLLRKIRETLDRPVR
jgi:PAS domain S-box-containing protein